MRVATCNMGFCIMYVLEYVVLKNTIKLFRDTVITDEEAQQLMCPPSPPGTLHILRKHILWFFEPPILYKK